MCHTNEMRRPIFEFMTIITCQRHMKLNIKQRKKRWIKKTRKIQSMCAQRRCTTQEMYNYCNHSSISCYLGVYCTLHSNTLYVPSKYDQNGIHQSTKDHLILLNAVASAALSLLVVAFIPLLPWTHICTDLIVYSSYQA